MQFTMRATGTGASGQVTLPGMKSTIAKPQPIQSIRSTPAWVPIMATAVFIMVAFWRKIRDFFGANGGRQSGRWFRDRSLGGKMVFIADDEVTSSSQKASRTSALPDAFTADGVRLSQQLSEVGSSRLVSCHILLFSFCRCCSFSCCRLSYACPHQKHAISWGAFSQSSEPLFFQAGCKCAGIDH